MQIIYAPAFIKQFADFEELLKEEIRQKILLFQDAKNHRSLKVHKLHGLLKDRYSFSVNYNYRIIFKYLSKNEVAILAVGGHDIYK